MIYIRYIFVFLLVPVLVVATPPACVLACVNELAPICEKGHTDFNTLCLSKIHKMVGCLVHSCPYGNFLSARDHFFGVCLELSSEFRLQTKARPKPQQNNDVDFFEEETLQREWSGPLGDHFANEKGQNEAPSHEEPEHEHEEPEHEHEESPHEEPPHEEPPHEEPPHEDPEPEEPCPEDHDEHEPEEHPPEPVEEEPEFGEEPEKIDPEGVLIWGTDPEQQARDADAQHKFLEKEFADTLDIDPSAVHRDDVQTSYEGGSYNYPKQEEPKPTTQEYEEEEHQYAPANAPEDNPIQKSETTTSETSETKAGTTTASSAPRPTINRDQLMREHGRYRQIKQHFEPIETTPLKSKLSNTDLSDYSVGKTYVQNRIRKIRQKQAAMNEKQKPALYRLPKPRTAKSRVISNGEASE